MIQRIITTLFVFLIVLSSCKSSYTKVLEGKDYQLQEKTAEELFAKEDYEKASPLYKALISSYAGTPKVEKMFYHYAFCDFGVEDYLLAAYEFKRLVTRFPRGEYTESAQYMAALAYYKESPPYYLDQEYTYKALEEFQLFVDRYPNSPKIKDVNEKMDDLLNKIRKKDIEKANLYYKIGDYKSAISSFKELLNKYPEYTSKEDFHFKMIDASYSLANKSIESKKAERYQNTIDYAAKYKAKYKEGKYVKKTDKISADSKDKLGKLDEELPNYYLKRKRYDDAISAWKKVEQSVSSKNTDKINQINNDLLSAYYEKALTSPTEEKLGNYKSFNTEFEKRRGKLAAKDLKFFEKKNEIAKNEISDLKVNTGYVLIDEGKYKQAIDFFEAYVKENGSSDAKIIYNLIQTKYDLAKKSKAENAYELLKSAKSLSEKHVDILSSEAYQSKSAALKSKVEKELEDYPMEIVEELISDGEYKSAMIKADQILNQDFTKKNKEEVVYLLIAASVKNAKQIKLFDWILKYERYERYVLAKKNYEKYVGLVTNEVLKSKIEKLKAKIDKGINKYQNLEE